MQDTLRAGPGRAVQRTSEAARWRAAQGVVLVQAVIAGPAIVLLVAVVCSGASAVGIALAWCGRPWAPEGADHCRREFPLNDRVGLDDLAPEAQNRSQHRIPSSNQHPISIGIRRVLVGAERDMRKKRSQTMSKLPYPAAAELQTGSPLMVSSEMLQLPTPPFASRIASGMPVRPLKDIA